MQRIQSDWIRTNTQYGNRLLYFIKTKNIRTIENYSTIAFLYLQSTVCKRIMEQLGQADMDHAQRQVNLLHSPSIILLWFCDGRTLVVVHSSSGDIRNSNNIWLQSQC